MWIVQIWGITCQLLKHKWTKKVIIAVVIVYPQCKNYSRDKKLRKLGVRTSDKCFRQDENIVNVLTARSWIARHDRNISKWCKNVSGITSLENVLQLEIVSPITAALMHIAAKCFIPFTLKRFVLVVAAVSAELRATLLNIICKI